MISKSIQLDASGGSPDPLPAAKSPDPRGAHGDQENLAINQGNWLSRRAIVKEIRSASNSYAKGLLLDVGCGSMPYERLLVNNVESYLGLDLRQPVLSAQDAGPHLLASAGDLPLPDNAFDTVVSFQVLEHVPVPQRMLAEIARVLRPGGHLILLAPQMWHLHEIPHDYFRYTKYGLRHLAEGSGLTVLDIRPISGFWIRAGLVVSYRIRRILSGSRSEGFAVMGLIQKAIIAASNIIFLGLDRLWPTPTDPINNLLIAKK